MTWPIATSALGPLSVGTIVWRRRGRPRVTAIAKATFSMIHGGFAIPTKPRPLALSEGAPGPSMAAERALEIWPDLSETDIVLGGHATTAGREPLAAVAIRLVVWRGEPLLDKTLHVFGDRRHADDYPKKFTTLPLSYERTRGGPGTWNPAGVDGRPANVVDPSREGEPAGFGPIAMTWPDRELELDAATLLDPNGWNWPEDISVERFQSAPKDQRVRGLRGDEWLVVDGFHADVPRFATRLPMPRANAWLSDETGRREPFGLRIDTVSIDMDALEVSLVWRASLPLVRELITGLRVTAELDLAPVEAIEPADSNSASKGLGVGMRLGERATKPPPPPSSSEAAIPFDPRPVAIASASHAPPPPLVMPPKRASEMGLVTPPKLAPPAFLAAHASSPGPIPPPPLEASPLVPPPRGPGPSSSRIPSATPPPMPSTELVPRTSALALVPPTPGSTLATVQPRDASAESGRSGIDRLPSESTPVPSAASDARRDDFESTQSGIRTAVIARLATKQSIADLGLAGADLSGLDLSGLILSGVSMAGTKLVGAKLRGTRLTSARLTGAVLTDADLFEADLSESDLSRAVLTRANLSGAWLSDANLTSADGSGAKLVGVRASRAIFTQGKWSGCSFQNAELLGADLGGASLDQARFDGANLTGARMVDAHGQGVSARGAKLEDANLAGVSFVGSNMDGIDAMRSVWDRAVLDRTTFRDAKLEGAGLSRTRADGTDFTAANLAKGSLMGASAENAVFDRSSLEGADLRQAKFGAASFVECKMARSNALKATFAGANLTKADLAGASLRSAKLRAATLAGATLSEADFRDADLEQADLRGADRATAKFAGANLKGAKEEGSG